MPGHESFVSVTVFSKWVGGPRVGHTAVGRALPAGLGRAIVAGMRGMPGGRLPVVPATRLEAIVRWLGDPGRHDDPASANRACRYGWEDAGIERERFGDFTLHLGPRPEPPAGPEKENRGAGPR